MRQPVSPITTSLCATAFGSGSARPAIVARVVPGGIELSHVSTGNAEGFEFAGVLNVGRSGIVPGGARTLIARASPSSSISGQAAADVMARAIGAPSAASTTNVYNVASAVVTSRETGGAAQPARRAAAINGQRFRVIADLPTASAMPRARPPRPFRYGARAGRTIPRGSPCRAQCRSRAPKSRPRDRSPAQPEAADAAMWRAMRAHRERAGFPLPSIPRTNHARAQVPQSPEFG